MPPFNAVEKQVPCLQGEQIDPIILRRAKVGVRGIELNPRVITKIIYRTRYIYKPMDSTQGKGGH